MFKVGDKVTVKKDITDFKRGTVDTMIEWQEADITLTVMSIDCYGDYHVSDGKYLYIFEEVELIKINDNQPSDSNGDF